MTTDTPHAAPLGGRPSIFTQAIANAICTRIMDGESLRKICEDDGMPARRTVFNWINSNPDFAAQYNQAREVQFDSWADEILEIGDTPEIGKKTTTRSGGTPPAAPAPGAPATDAKPTPAVETVEGDMIEHRKLRCDNRKWLLSKLASKKFGDRIAHELSGGIKVTGGLPDEEPPAPRVVTPKPEGTDEDL